MMVEDAWKEGRKAWKLKRDGKKNPFSTDGKDGQGWEYKGIF